MTTDATNVDLTPAELAAIRRQGISAGVVVWADARKLIVALERINSLVPGRGGIVTRMQRVVAEASAEPADRGGLLE